MTSFALPAKQPKLAIDQKDDAFENPRKSKLFYRTINRSNGHAKDKASIVEISSVICSQFVSLRSVLFDIYTWSGR